MFVTCLSHLIANSQNLVLNSSFEDENLCESKHPCSPSGWFYTVSGSYAGYFIHDIPAATGKRWLSLVSGSRISTGERQYWQTILLKPLIKGKKYKLSLSLHGWDIEPDLSDIGFYFSSHMLFYPVDTLIQPKEYVNFNDARLRKLRGGWLRLEKEYVATENDQIMFVGNFSSENSQEIARKRFSRSKYIGVIIDDLIVEPVEPIDCSSCDFKRDSIYALNKRHPSTPDLLLRAKAEAAVAIPELTPSTSTDTLILRNLLFDFGKHQLLNPKQLDFYGNYFKDDVFEKVIILGYTDDTGDKKVNDQLSQKRADEILRLINEKFPVYGWDLEAKGMGVSTFFSLDSDNRRVEIHFIRKTQN
ncbi:MAG: OmpA family protein [Flavitalea sp.]